MKMENFLETDSHRCYNFVYVIDDMEFRSEKNRKKRLRHQSKRLDILVNASGMLVKYIEKIKTEPQFTPK